MKRLLVLLAIMLSFNLQAFASTPNFTDISDYPWAQTQINRLTTNGILKGTGHGKFSPESNITRADYVVIMSRLLDLDVDFDSNFSDVKSDKYYYKAIGMARELGLVKGITEDKFNPESFITRQDMFVLTHRILEISNVSMTEKPLTFTDANAISGYAVPYISELTDLIRGDHLHRINPLNNTTRAEAAVFISRVQEKFDSIPTPTPSPSPTSTPTSSAPTNTPKVTSGATKIALFAGHGGGDSGAVSNGVKEKDLNLTLNNKLAKILRDNGYEVITNRTTDVDRSITADAKLADSNDVDLVVELHFNSNDGTPASGTETYHSILNQGKGKELAQEIAKNIAALGYINRGAKTRVNDSGTDYYGIIRLPSAPAVLVEVCFINNPLDMAKYDADKVAKAIADAIIKVYPTRK